MSTRFEKYWTESGRGDGQGDVEKKDNQLYRRPYMMGKARGKVSVYDIYIAEFFYFIQKRRMINELALRLSITYDS